MFRHFIARLTHNLTKLGILTALLMGPSVVTVSAAHGATYYVATNGNDSNPGSLSQPFRTVAKGTSALKSGDTLYIRGGTYDEFIPGSAIPAGTLGAHTTIAGYQNENPVLKPSYSTEFYNVYFTNITLFNGYITLQDFTIDNSNAPASGERYGGCAYLNHNTRFLRMSCINASGSGLRVVGHDTMIRDSVIRDCGRYQKTTAQGEHDTKGVGIYANSDGSGPGSSHTTNLIIEKNIIENCRAGGIAVHQQPETKNVTIRNNIIRNFGMGSKWPQTPGAVPQSGVGIVLGHGSSHYVYNNLIYNGGHQPAGTGPGGSGLDTMCLFTWAGGGPYHFYNNTCHDMDVGLYAFGSAGSTIARNNIFSKVRHVQVIWNGSKTVNSNYSTSSVFVNAAANDFHLQAGSPGIGEGINLAEVVMTDFDGVSRGSSYDIGAYQFVAIGIAQPSAPVNVQLIRY